MSYYRYERFRPVPPKDTPGTNFLILVNAATFLLTFLHLLPERVIQLLVSDAYTVWNSPWTFFTYPLVSRSQDAFKFLSLLFSLLWLYYVGGKLERAWGTRRFLVAFFSFSAISAFFISLGGLLVRWQSPFGELLCPLVDLTVVWAMMEPDVPVLLFGAIPMQLRWLAVIISLMLVFQFGNPYWPLGLFALGGCLAATLYARYLRGYRPMARYRNPLGSGRARPGRRFSLNPFEWYRRWQFRRRFRRLWGE